MLDFGSVRAGMSPTERLSVTTDTSVYGARPPAPTCGAGTLTIGPAPVPEEMQGGTITRTYDIRVSPTAHIGLISETVAMAAPGGSGEGPGIIVTGTVVGAVAASALVVTFDTTAGHSQTQTVTLTARSQRSLQGLRTAASDPTVTARVAAVGHLSAQIAVTFSPSAPEQIQPTITIETPEGQQLDIRVLATARAGAGG
jgi:hypothetical protein